MESDRNITLKEIKKKNKYKDIRTRNRERMWQMKTEVNPVVVDAVGTVKKWMVETSRKYQRERL